jgi:hypothetical protein
MATFAGVVHDRQGTKGKQGCGTGCDIRHITIVPGFAD